MPPPRLLSGGGWYSSLRLLQNVAEPQRGACHRPHLCAELALGRGRDGGESQRQDEQISGDVLFNAAALPADVLSHHGHRKCGTRIEHRREDKVYVSKHSRRDGEGRGVSGLLPSSRWHIGKHRPGRRETEGGEFSFRVKRRVEWRISDTRKVRRRRRFRWTAQKNARVQEHELHRPRQGDAEDLRKHRLSYHRIAGEARKTTLCDGGGDKLRFAQ